MSTNLSIRFRCPTCQARINAPIQLGGMRRKCPGCQSALVVPQGDGGDSGPMLVPMEVDERFAIAVRPSAGVRVSAPPVDWRRVGGHMHAGQARRQGAAQTR